MLSRWKLENGILGALASSRGRTGCHNSLNFPIFQIPMRLDGLEFLLRVTFDGLALGCRDGGVGGAFLAPGFVHERAD